MTIATTAHRRLRGSRRPVRRLLAIAFVGALVGLASPSLADEHRSEEAGHPLRIIAYAVHPIGVIVDTLVFQPAHWVVHRAEWLEVLFGHEDH